SGPAVRGLRSSWPGSCRNSVLCGWLSRGGLPGEGEKDIVEAGPAQRQVADARGGGGQPGGDRGQDGRTVGDGDYDTVVLLVNECRSGAETDHRRGEGGRVRAGRDRPRRGDD